MKFPIRDQ